MFVFEWSVIIPASVISAAISGLASYAVAKHTSRAEVKKLKLSWQRQDSLSDDQKMHNLLTFVSLYLYSDSLVYFDQAISYVSAALGIFPGKLGSAVYALHVALTSSDQSQIEECFKTVSSLYCSRKSCRHFKKPR